MLREESENWVEKDTWKKTDSNSEISEPSSDNDYFHVDSMKEFQDALEGKNSEKIVLMKTVNQLIKKINSELQQIQKAISESISSDTLLQKLAQEFDELYKKCLSSEAITDYYKETLESNASVKKKTDTSEQIIAEYKTLSWTACYNDSCYIHMLNKNATEYYSKKSRKPHNQVVWEAWEISKSEQSALTWQDAVMKLLNWEVFKDKHKMRKDQTLW